ncbi:MAG: DUF2066 domain-containing protein [Thiomicrospira sp.]
MRTFALVTILGWLWLIKPTWAQTDMDLFIIEKPIEAAQEKDLDEVFRSAMSDLLIRAVGSKSVIQSPASVAYLTQARQWIKHYQFVNRESDGVVIGRMLRVEFDRARLLKAFQRDQIVIWPYSERPDTLLLGQWEQRGLSVNLSEESLQYRVDLDYRDEATLLGLPITLAANDQFYQGFDVVSLMQQASLPADLQARFAQSGQDYLMLFKADVIGGVTRFEWALFSLKNAERIRHADLSAEAFMPLLSDTLSSLLAIYSRPYRESAGALGLLHFDISGVQAYEDFEKIEQALTQLRPRVQEVRLVRVEGALVRFELIYQGYYTDVVRRLSALPIFASLTEAVAGVQISAQFSP